MQRDPESPRFLDTPANRARLIEIGRTIRSLAVKGEHATLTVQIPVQDGTIQSWKMKLVKQFR